jgi:hypothetical protein
MKRTGIFVTGVKLNKDGKLVKAPKCPISSSVGLARRLRS